MTDLAERTGDALRTSARHNKKIDVVEHTGAHSLAVDKFRLDILGYRRDLNPSESAFAARAVVNVNGEAKRFNRLRRTDGADDSKHCKNNNGVFYEVFHFSLSMSIGDTKLIWRATSD